MSKKLDVALETMDVVEFAQQTIAVFEPWQTAYGSCPWAHDSGTLASMMPKP